MLKKGLKQGGPAKCGSVPTPNALSAMPVPVISSRQDSLPSADGTVSRPRRSVVAEKRCARDRARIAESSGQRAPEIKNRGVAPEARRGQRR